MTKIRLAAVTTALFIGAACADSQDTDYTATTDYNTDTAAGAPATTDTATGTNTKPDALLVERTAVVAVDTNATSSAQSSSNSLTNSSANSSSASADDSNAQSASSGAPASSQSGQSSSSAQNPSSANSQSSQYIDHQVLDQQGQPVGTVEALWDDPSGQPAYLAVKQPNREDMIVIPTDHVEVSQNRNAIRVPFTAQTRKQAPAFSKEAELDPQAEQKVIAFFRQHEDQSQQNQRNQSAGQSSQTQAAVPSDAQQQDQATIRLKEEQLKIGKREVQAGGVILRKVVRTETVNKPVQLKHEELVIQRVPGSDQKVQANAQFGEKEIFIPLRREEPVVQKDVVLKEVVNVNKKTEQQQRDISAKLREEQLKIQRTGEAAGSGAPGESGRSQSGDNSPSGQSVNSQTQDNSSGPQSSNPGQSPNDNK